jgi:hypothetical protein
MILLATVTIITCILKTGWICSAKKVGKLSKCGEYLQVVSHVFFGRRLNERIIV